MNIIGNGCRRNLLAVTAAVAVAIAGGATTGTARASTFASAILDINNFRLLHSNGSAYASSDFRNLTGTNDAHATAQLNGVFANGADSRPILSGIQPDVSQQCVGAPCPPIGQNNFTRYNPIPPVPGTFGYADQRLQGSSIAINGTPAGAHAQTRADASTAQNIQMASGNSDVGTSTTFAFVLGASDTMTVSMTATPYSAAYVSPGSNPTANANARISWSINIVDLGTNTSVFTFTPAELNALTAVSRTDGMGGLLEYNAAGTTYSLASTTALLRAGTTYQITIQQNTLANATQQEVPEPGALAVVAAGLLSIGAVRRRRPG